MSVERAITSRDNLIKVRFFCIYVCAVSDYEISTECELIDYLARLSFSTVINRFDRAPLTDALDPKKASLIRPIFVACDQTRPGKVLRWIMQSSHTRTFGLLARAVTSRVTC